ncbi:hypothetical protein ARAM_006448 [Aspergillus rambellii]|uniref:Glucosamine 6-phosphate N-acetyltransferase n=1 Tax=Aspergillus rambellii TaxID=308745 RepID=A0A0F8XIL5_9EURO|nr:hypothetical protein ARAM_006448 [Aspergillus rambellii]
MPSAPLPLKPKPTQAIFTTSLLPPGPNNVVAFTLPTRTIPHPPTNPSVLNDALAVRLQVFVDEQKCAPDLEIDEDDSRSWHWVIYDENHRPPGSDSNPMKVPVAVLRLVPPPHASHDDFAAMYGDANANANASQDEETSSGDGDGDGDATPRLKKYDLTHEAHIKFGRVAVLPEYRGYGLARKLMEMSMAWAAGNAAAINASLARVVREECCGGLARGARVPVWKGLALVHAQVWVEKFYERLGFETDEEMGRWSEVGIEHVGMWKRLDGYRVRGDKTR